MISIYRYESPLGNIIMAGDETYLMGLWFEGQKYFGQLGGGDTGSIAHLRCEEKMTSSLEMTAGWLDIYFGGKLPDFLPPLYLSGSDFRREVWGLLLDIPCGSTRTYGSIAEEIAAVRGRASMSAQAVGGAVGHNPISVIVPCHRVVGSGGDLTGYAGGTEKKRWLLEHEAEIMKK